MAKTTVETFEGTFCNTSDEYAPCDHASLLFRDGTWVLARGDKKDDGRYSYLTGQDVEIMWNREDVAKFDFETRITVNGKKKDFWSVIRVEVGNSVKPGTLLAYKDAKGYHILHKMTPSGLTWDPTTLANILSICPQAAEREVKI